MEFLPYLGGVATALSLCATVALFVIRAEVKLAIATAVRERIEAIAALRAHIAENFASKDGVASWMREFKADMDGRLNRIEAKIDRIAERSGHD